MFVEIVITEDRGRAEALSDALLECGALSATIEDADAGSSDEQALYGEPGSEAGASGWRRSTVVALFDGATDVDTALGDVLAALGITESPRTERRTVADANWVGLTQSQFAPIAIGERLWIVPSWHEPPTTRDDAIVLRLDPGMAFGTGDHATTRLCLRWLERHLVVGERVIDFGCGSGILAIAAAKLGAGDVVGTDIDEQAIVASRANAVDNGVEPSFTSSKTFHAEPADLVIANILSNPLKVLAPLLTSLVKPTGRLVLSGILERQWEEVAAAYAPAIALDVWASDAGWVCLAGRPRDAGADDGSRDALHRVHDGIPDHHRAGGRERRHGPLRRLSQRLQFLDALVRVEELDVVEEVDVATESGAHDGAAPVDDEAAADAPAAIEKTVEPSDESVEPGFVGERAITSAWWLPELEAQRTPSGGPTTDSRVTTGSASRIGSSAGSGSGSSTGSGMPMSSRPGDLGTTATRSIAGVDAGFLRPDPPEPASSALRWILGTLSLFAALTLLAQLAYLGRDEIAARWSPSRPWLAAACEPFGCIVGHPAHAASITIESTSVQVGQGANVYVMTALLRNREAIDLRYPHLELVLTDLQDRPIVRRALRPEDYLPSGRAPSAGFPAESELPVHVAFELNNLRFTGYRVNQFYP